MPTPRKPLRETRFANKRLHPVGVELMTLAQLRSRVAPELLFQAERVAFFMILVVTAGPGEHLVDFERITLQTGDVVFVRPGQVQQWDSAAGLDADLLLIEPAALRPTNSPFGEVRTAIQHQEAWPAHFAMDANDLATWQMLAATLRHELHRTALDEASATLARALLGCMMISLSRTATGQATQPPQREALLRHFQRALEARVRSRPSVAALAATLRVSPSTLSRTCKDVLGRSAKAEIDRRVALEAQRLLVHSPATSVAIGEFLGFSEPTNFIKFFRRSVGTTPEAFRRTHRLHAR